MHDSVYIVKHWTRTQNSDLKAQLSSHLNTNVDFSVFSFELQNFNENLRMTLFILTEVCPQCESFSVRRLFFFF